MNFVNPMIRFLILINHKPSCSAHYTHWGSRQQDRQCPLRHNSYCCRNSFAKVKNSLEATNFIHSFCEEWFIFYVSNRLCEVTNHKPHLCNSQPSSYRVHGEERHLRRRQRRKKITEIIHELWIWDASVDASSRQVFESMTAPHTAD